MPSAHAASSMSFFVIRSSLASARIHARAEPVPAALLHDLEQARLVPALDERTRAPLHACSSGVCLQAPAPAARAAQSSWTNHHMADLAAGPPAVVELAVQDETTSDARADPRRADLLNGRPAPRWYSPRTPTLTSFPTLTFTFPSCSDTSEPSSTRSVKPGTFAASRTAPAFASTSPGVPIPMPRRSASDVPAASSEARIVPTMASMTSRGFPVWGVSTRALPTTPRRAGPPSGSSFRPGRRPR